MRVGVLFSGNGTNLKSILECAELNPRSFKVVCAITDNIRAPGIEHALNHFVPVTLLGNPKKQQRDQWERTISSILRGYDVQLVVLAGFMRVLHEEFCNQWTGRCINIHPSLLPAYPGLNTHKRVLDAGEKWHGCTIHYVTPEVDGGPIIASWKIEVTPEDTVESLKRNVLLCENILLPQVILSISEGNIVFNRGEVK